MSRRVNEPVGRTWTPDQDLQERRAERGRRLCYGESDYCEPPASNEESDPDCRKRQCRAEATTEPVEDQRNVRQERYTDVQHRLRPAPIHLKRLRRHDHRHEHNDASSAIPTCNPRLGRDRKRSGKTPSRLISASPWCVSIRSAREGAVRVADADASVACSDAGERARRRRAPPRSASAPLLPAAPPARSQACSAFSTVMHAEADGHAGLERGQRARRGRPPSRRSRSAACRRGSRSRARRPPRSGRWPPPAGPPGRARTRPGTGSTSIVARSPSSRRAASQAPSSRRWMISEW